jgi:eukaryotic-like serine/threonine-protein kinase
VVICVEYCPGGSLQKKFEAGPMPLKAVKKAATETLLGLGALHSRKMLHRDIKPANILLDGQGVAKLADFGLVTDDLILGYGSQAGYNDHIAYEVWHNGPTSPKSDIWAVGMTLFRLLHGQVWYREAPDPRLIIEQGGFVDTLKWLPHIPKSWRTFIRCTLQDDPARRFQNTDQALKALAALTVDPMWAVEVTPDEVKWERAQGQRRIKLEWERISERKHRWRAWSDPLTNGQSRSLAGSGGIVGKNEALDGMRSFFRA